MPQANDPRLPATPPPDPRTPWLGLAVVGAAAVVAFVITIGIFVPAIGQLGAGAGGSAGADPSALPELILVCDREYARADVSVELTLAEILARDGRDPTVVRAVPDAGCPSGACIAGGLCLTLVYVRTAPERYVAYELQGGP